MSLLDIAKSVSTSRRGDLPLEEEELELAVAFFNGEVTVKGITKALKAPTAQQASNIVFSMLRDGVRQGKIKITLV